MSTNNPYSDPNAAPQAPGQPQFQQPKKSSSGLIIVIICLALFIPVMGVCVGLLLPAVQAAREAARRMSCSNNLKQVGVALQNYNAVHGVFPPAYTVDAQGRRLHSWRTLILPYMEQQALYERIDLSKPWDDPANQAVANSAVMPYQCPSTPGDPTMTTYVAIVDPGGIMSGATASSYADITDGGANTVIVTETDSGNAVHWMSPEDIDLPTFLDAGSKRRGGHVGGGHSLMADGAVIFFTDSMDTNLRESLVTKAGGEQVQY